jgi:hypothetical protein
VDDAVGRECFIGGRNVSSVQAVHPRLFLRSDLLLHVSPPRGQM